ncbi:MAG: polysaccharide deacetylase family protein [Acidimicrobiales bacterium]
MANRRTILMYHRIADDPLDPYSLCVSPGRFEAQVKAILESADIVGLDHLRDRTSRPQVVITFDDGYADNLTEALPIAERVGFPMTVFVTSGMLDGKAGFWWDRLALLLHGREEIDIDLQIDDRRLRILLQGEGCAARSLVALHSRLRGLPKSSIESCLVELSQQLATPMPEPARARVLTADELRAMAASPLVTIGAHTVSHEMLAGRPVAHQVEMIGESKRSLEAILGLPVEHFAYPFGDGAAFDRTSVNTARTCGFRTACTGMPGRVSLLNDRLRLPRQMVRDWDARQIRQRLAAWRSI